ncbi:MAG: Crp/Fnr family transcriptional regulator [Candidatus Binatia bacterium]
MPDLLPIVRFLGATRLCEGLDPRSLATLARAAGYREIEPGEFMFRQGLAANTAYLLRFGHARLVQGTSDGAPAVVRFVCPGDLFGSAALVPDQSYPVSAVSARWCQLLAWKGTDMTDLMQSCPRLALNVLRELNAETQEICVRYRALATQGVEQRLAALLVRLAATAGRQTHAGLTIDFPLSRRDLAEMTGTTLYTVSRILSAWARDGLVDTGRRWVAILRPRRLAATAAQAPRKAVRRQRSEPTPSRAVAA